MLVISVFQFVAVAGQAYSQDVGADLGPHDVKLVFEGPFTVDWNEPNRVLRASLLATNVGVSFLEITGFRWGVFDDANPLTM